MNSTRRKTAVLLLIGAAGASAAGYGYWSTQRPTLAALPPKAPAAPEPQTTALAPDPAPDPVPEAVESAASPPAFDLVRAEADGMTLVAGTALPNEVVRILVNGEVQDRSIADASGKFVSFLELGPSSEPRVIRLVISRDGGEVISDGDIIIAPTPVAVAEADPVTEADEGIVADPVVEETAVAEATPEAQPEAVANLAPEPEPQEAPQTPEVTQAAPVSNPAAAIAEQTIAALAPDATTSVTPPVAAPRQPTPSTAVPQAQDTPAPERVTKDAASLTQPAPQNTPVAQTDAPAPRPALTAAVSEPAAPGAPGDVPDVSPTPQVASDPLQPPSPTVILSRRDGIEVLQGAGAGASGPDVVTNLALDAISYDAEGEVALSGRAPSEGFVRVYLNNTALITRKIEADGRWRADLPEVDTGVYTLRVDQLDAAGEVVSRVESPFKREDPAILAASDPGGQGASVRVVTVQPGNTLWAIARDRYGEGLAYVRVFQANRDRIRDPDLIYPGQVFDLPDQ